jgi:Pyridoxamine 5'-phosphate oxidase
MPPRLEQDPIIELVGAFSSPGAIATTWAEARGTLHNAELYWLSTVRPDGRPHVTPLLGIWHDDATYFCTGSTERKARNLAQNANCVIATGCNHLSGLDVVVEGEALPETDGAELAHVADAFEAKYGAHFTAPSGTWFGLGDAMRNGEALVFRVAPPRILAFAKGTQYSQTRYRFSSASA